MNRLPSASRQRNVLSLCTLTRLCSCTFTRVSSFFAVLVACLILASLSSSFPRVAYDHAGHVRNLESAQARCEAWGRSENDIKGADGGGPTTTLWALPVGWTSNSCDDQQWLFRRIRAALGVDLRCVYGGESGIPGNTDVIDRADIFLISHLISHTALDRFIRRYPSRPRVFITFEVYNDWIHHVLHFVDGAIGSRMPSEVLSAAKSAGGHLPQPPSASVLYTRFPFFVVCLTAPETCQFRPELLSGPNLTAEEWASRPHFAALIARHEAYPRKALFSNISALGAIDAPSLAFHNVEWEDNKAAFARRRRFIITPENVLVGGYVSEKIFDAHLSGTVPIWWGHPGSDLDPEPGILNPARVLFLKDGPGIDPQESMTQLLRQIDSIDRDVPSGSRAAFFAQPAFWPGAQTALTKLCDGFVEVFCSALSRPARRNPSTLPTAGIGKLLTSFLVFLEDVFDIDLVT
jgi:hypothetical protein